MHTYSIFILYTYIQYIHAYIQTYIPFFVDPNCEARSFNLSKVTDRGMSSNDVR